MSRPVISKEDIDRFVHAVRRFDDARDQLAQAQQIVVTEMGILRTLLERSGVLPLEKKQEFKTKLYGPKRKISDSVFCGHANENPQTCVCADDCYCKANTCKGS